jgi:hypothetical protein
MDVEVSALRSLTMHNLTSPSELIKKITDTVAMNNYVKRFRNLYIIRKLPFGVECRLSEPSTVLDFLESDHCSDRQLNMTDFEQSRRR